MDNSNSIAPVGATPVIAPLGQRKPRAQQEAEKAAHSAKDEQKPEENNQGSSDNSKERGLDCYA